MANRPAVHEVEHAAKIGVKDLGHRMEGFVARLFGAPDAPVSDATLVERVRARLGHVCTHPHAIEVSAKGHGEIELRGPIEAAEADHVVAALARVRGVRGIDDDLSRVEHLPGGSRPRADVGLGRVWTPSLRLALGVLSVGVAVSSLLRARPLSFVLGTASALGLARNMVTRGGLVGSPRRLLAAAHEVEQRVTGGRSRVAGEVGGFEQEPVWTPPNMLDPDFEAPTSGDMIDR